MTPTSKILSFDSPAILSLVEAYQANCLYRHDRGTIRVYTRILRHFLTWVSKRSGKTNQFQPELLTTAAVDQYLSTLTQQGYSLSHRKRAKSVIKQFCQWLVEEKGGLTRNPAYGVTFPSSSSTPPAPHVLTPAQRYILHALVAQEDRRGKALFALGYRVGCRAIDVVNLRFCDVHVGPRSGWLHLAGEGAQSRDIDLSNEARRLLYDYQQHRAHDQGSLYFFTSQRSPQLTADGLYHWFRALKRKATPQDQELIADVSFHDLRDDFAHRAKEAGWTLEELAYYLGYMMKGTLTLQTTIRYTQMTRAQVKEKLKILKR